VKSVVKVLRFKNYLPRLKKTTMLMMKTTREMRAVVTAAAVTTAKMVEMKWALIMKLTPEG
jgi:hypothetical protein